MLKPVLPIVKNALKFLCCSALVGVFVFAAPASAEEPRAWLVRMSEAFATQNYDGVFVYSHGASMETLRIIHSVKEGVERERIVRLDGPVQEIIRQDGKVTCVHGSDWNGNINHKIPLGPFARAFVRDMSELGNSYQLVEKGNGRVAGREARVLLIQPSDDYRYGYRIWLDEETGLLLKSVLVHRGKVLERFQFTRLNIAGDIDEAVLEDGTGADTITYTDGMAAFSVFIEKIVNQKYEEVTAQKGATVAVTRIVNYPEGDHLVTVVGEIPMKTAKRIALSVAPTVVASSDGVE